MFHQSHMLLEYQLDIWVRNSVECLFLVERNDCCWNVLHVAVIHNVSYQVEIIGDGSARYTTRLVCLDALWEDRCSWASGGGSKGEHLLPLDFAHILPSMALIRGLSWHG